MKAFGILVCLLMIAPAFGQVGVPDSAMQASINWFRVAELCQRSIPYYSKEEIKRELAIELISSWGVTYEIADKFADISIQEHSQAPSPRSQDALKSLGHEFEGSELQSMICQYDAWHARRQFQTELRKINPKMLMDTD